MISCSYVRIARGGDQILKTVIHNRDAALCVSSLLLVSPRGQVALAFYCGGALQILLGVPVAKRKFNIGNIGYDGRVCDFVFW